MQDTTAASPQTHAEPISAAERFHSMDMLRGVAILGILVMNIYAFAMPFAAYNNPLLMGGDDAVNLGVWFFTHLFFDQKFMAIFSMLYGAGVIMFWERAQARGLTGTGLFYRRSFWLLLFGLAHGILLWMGDILFMYALTGMLVFLFRKLSPRTLFIVAAFWLPVAPLLSAVSAPYMYEMQADANEVMQLEAAGEELDDEQRERLKDWQQTRAFMAPTPGDVQKDVEAYLQSYPEVVAYRTPLVLGFQIQGTLFYGLWRAGGLMLLGMALMKLGVLKGQYPVHFYRRMMLAGYAVGLPLMVYSASNLWAHRFDGLFMFEQGMMPNYFASIAVSLGHVGGVLWLAGSGRLEGLLRRFAAVGRMAFTNYLMHSLVMTSIFYGYGLGLYGQFPRSLQMGFVIAMIAMQLLLSPWWLSRFRFGPAEWLWRSLTYWRLQPLLRAEPGSAGRQLT